MRRVDSLEKTLMLGEIGGRTKGDDREWDCWMASPTRWTWIWVNSGSWWWTGRTGVLRFMGSQRVIRLSNWTESFFCILNFLYCFSVFSVLLCYSLPEKVLKGQTFLKFQNGWIDACSTWEDTFQDITYVSLKIPTNTMGSPGGSAVKNPPALQEMWVWSQSWKDPLEEGIATQSSFSPGESHGQRSLAGYRP